MINRRMKSAKPLLAGLMLVLLALFSTMNQAHAGWPLQLGGDNADIKIAVNDRGEVYVVGICKAEVDLDLDPEVTGNDILACESERLFVAKYSAQKELQWHRITETQSTADKTTISALEFDSGGNLYIAGRIGGSAITVVNVFGTHSARKQSAFVARITPTGTWDKVYQPELRPRVSFQEQVDDTRIRASRVVSVKANLAILGDNGPVSVDTDHIAVANDTSIPSLTRGVANFLNGRPSNRPSAKWTQLASAPSPTLVDLGIGAPWWDKWTQDGENNDTRRSWIDTANWLITFHNEVTSDPSALRDEPILPFYHYDGQGTLSIRNAWPEDLYDKETIIKSRYHTLKNSLAENSEVIQRYTEAKQSEEDYLSQLTEDYETALEALISSFTNGSGDSIGSSVSMRTTPEEFQELTDAYFNQYAGWASPGGIVPEAITDMSFAVDSSGDEVLFVAVNTQGGIGTVFAVNPLDFEPIDNFQNTRVFLDKDKRSPAWNTYHDNALRLALYFRPDNTLSVNKLVAAGASEFYLQGNYDLASEALICNRSMLAGVGGYVAKMSFGDGAWSCDWIVEYGVSSWASEIELTDQYLLWASRGGVRYIKRASGRDGDYFLQSIPRVQLQNLNQVSASRIGLAVDKDRGDVYISGNYNTFQRSNGTFGAPSFEAHSESLASELPSTKVSGDNSNWFVAKLNNRKQFIWLAGAEGESSAIGSDVALNRSGTSLFVGGEFAERLAFDDKDSENPDTQTIFTTDPDNKNGFVARLDIISGKLVKDEVYAIGKAITPPADADPERRPEVWVDGMLCNVDDDCASYFWWSDFDNQLYVIGESTSKVTLKWYDASATNMDIPDKEQVVRIGYGDETFQKHVPGVRVNLAPATYEDAGEVKALSYYTVYHPTLSASDLVENQQVFKSTTPGRSVIHYLVKSSDSIENNPATQKSVFQIVETANLNQRLINSTCSIGSALVAPAGYAPQGYVTSERARYDATLIDQATGQGPIIPVNTVPVGESDFDSKLIVAWSKTNDYGQYWPETAIEYDCTWPEPPVIASTDTETPAEGEAESSEEENSEAQALELLQAGKIRISDLKGSGALPSVMLEAQVYSQPDSNLPGYNPNEEHAGIYDNTVFALRSDLNSVYQENDPNGGSEPYVLVKYKHVDTGQWAFKVYAVESGVDEVPFHPVEGSGKYKLEAGLLFQPPAPLVYLPVCAENDIELGAAGWEDHKGNFWARKAGSVTAQYYYPLQPGFFYDLDADGEADAEVGDCVPWLDRLDDGTINEPVVVQYAFTWPKATPILKPGQTLFKSQKTECAVAETESGDQTSSETANCFLPNIDGQSAVTVIYDQAMEEDGANPYNSLVKLFDPLSERRIALDKIPEEIATVSRGGKRYFSDLPALLRSRVFYDEMSQELVFKGTFDDSQIIPQLLPNIMTARELSTIESLEANQAGNTPFKADIARLYGHTRNPSGLIKEGEMFPYTIGLDKATITGIDDNGDGFADDFVDTDGNYIDDRIDAHPAVCCNQVTQQVRYVAAPVSLLEKPMALTAGKTAGEGYVTLAINNDPSLDDAAVSLEVIKVDASFGVYQGAIWVVPSDNIFEETLTLRFSGDFGGDPDNVVFEWYYQLDANGQPAAPASRGGDGEVLAPTSPWVLFDSGAGLLDITLQGPGLITLSDNWFITRYGGQGEDTGLPAGENDTIPSAWAGDPSYNRFAESSDPAVEAKGMLAEGWIKRVIRGLNPFDQRVSDFYSNEVNTLTAMIAQAGEPYAGAIPFNPDADVVNGVGMIEAYQTVLERGEDLSINAGFNSPAANNQLLNAATRIADLYVLLGNEAYADALDPTIGFASDGELGSVASSMFAFQNQLQSPLEEELVLLRGRDDSRAGVSAHPVNNRLFWNFTQGNGEVAYVNSYGITDQNKDGFITETDARIMHPQGHGDAWGHYLSATKSRYRLLQHPHFAWVPRTESVLVGDVPVEIDYLDERKFALAAAAKAKVGAEIVNLTYRERYVEAPAGQWQGYKDTVVLKDHNAAADSDAVVARAWGVDGWGRRAGQGAYFDWLTANAILPAQDPNPEHTGIKKIDRTTVLELTEIATQFALIQSKLDEADAGLNPLGLAKGVVPFDIDPAYVSPGSDATHFDQIASRAKVALDNAVRVFDHASQQTQSLRALQNDTDTITGLVAEQEQDYKHQLIELFGYPYQGDIGAGKTYPSGYDGPDLYHYMYVNSELTSEVSAAAQVDITAYYAPLLGPESGFFFNADVKADYVNDDLDAQLKVEYPVHQGVDWSFMAPSDWKQRRAPGELQSAVSAILQAKVQLKQAQLNHANVLKEIETAAELARAEFGLNMETVQILQRQRKLIRRLNAAIGAAHAANVAANRVAWAAEVVEKPAITALPRVNGFSNDVTGPIRATLSALSIIGESTAFVIADAADIAEFSLSLAKEDVALGTEIKLTQDTDNLALMDRLQVFESLVREEAVLRLEMITQQEVLTQAMASYHMTLARAQRLLDERAAYRVKIAGDVQVNRYSDMTFRVFRNDALQKYRAAFDLAARYVYLAATAYDYETNLLGSSGAGRQFLADIVRQRSLGQMIDGEPVAGTPGLADVLARLSQNFEVYRGQLGFNNPQTETNRFSLRHELFRLAASDEQWQKTLEFSRVDNLWDVPEFSRYVRPFAPESEGAQPGLVIRFPTTVSFGRNFFGHKLGGGDSAYDPTNFATKIRAVGTWFSNYDGTGLSNTPRVYLVPVGMDILRSPDGDNFETREWRVVDQKLPAPFPIGDADLKNANWMPVKDSLSDTYGEIRRMSSYRAYHDSGEYDPSEAITDSRLVGRSVWNSEWMLIIPGGTLNYDPQEGLERLIYGQKMLGGERDGNGITDILLHFQTYGFSGN